MLVKYTVSQAHALLTAEMLLKMGVGFSVEALSPGWYRFTSEDKAVLKISDFLFWIGASVETRSARDASQD